MSAFRPSIKRILLALARTEASGWYFVAHIIYSRLPSRYIPHVPHLEYSVYETSE